MRIIKQRLIEMLPDASVFLDVDDLKSGRGAEYALRSYPPTLDAHSPPLPRTFHRYVDVSSIVLVLCTRGYFQSPNCMRELLRAVVTCKPIVTLVEPVAIRGGLSRDEIEHEIRVTEAQAKCHKWGLATEVEGWGYALPTSWDLIEALFAAETIEWNRIGAFQDVTMRLIAERLLMHQLAPRKKTSKRTEPDLRVYLQGELANQQLALPPPRQRGGFHVYCSEHSPPGALELMRELAGQLDSKLVDSGASRVATRSREVRLLHVSSSTEALGSCEHMLLYLTELTWTRGAESAQLAADVQRAMDMGVHVLLAHEMLGIGQEARNPCEFGNFFVCERGTTPQELLQQDVYGEVAVALRGGKWRHASMVMLAEAIAYFSEEEEASLKETGSSESEEPSLLTRLFSSRTRDRSANAPIEEPPAEVPPAEVPPMDGVPLVYVAPFAVQADAESPRRSAPPHKKAAHRRSESRNAPRPSQSHDAAPRRRQRKARPGTTASGHHFESSNVSNGDTGAAPPREQATHHERRAASRSQTSTSHQTAPCGRHALAGTLAPRHSAAGDVSNEALSC